MRQPTISLCMIVKNEADCLPRCLASVTGAVDEMIVVDTGSTDETVTIAKQFGAHVVSSPWRNDFADARNAGINHAKGDWILFLDADEELDASDKEKLRMYARHDEFEAFFLQIHNYLGEGSQGATINPVLRMFKNRSQYRFEGRIHEQISISICRHMPDAAFHISDMKIHHYGYKAEIVKTKDKIRRNMQLLQQMLSEKPDDPFTQYNIGVEYLRMSDINKALDAFRKVRRLADPAATYAHLSLKYEIRCLQALGQTEEAVKLCDEGIELYPAYTDLFHLKGMCLFQLQKFQDAKFAIHRAFELGPSPSSYHTEEGIGTYQTCYALGQLYEAMRDYNSAIDWYVQALRYKASLNPPLYRIFHLMKCNGAQSQIATFITERFNWKTEEAIPKLIKILFETDCIAPIETLTEQLKHVRFSEYNCITKLSCRLLKGDLKSARSAMRRIHSNEKSKLAAWLRWLESGDGPLSEELLSNEEELPFSVKLAFRNQRINDGLHMIKRWRDKIESLESAKRMVRTLACLADFHLEALSNSTRYKTLLRDARMTAPHEDGF